MPPPPLVPPEALEDLNRLAGFTSDLEAPRTAGEDDRGVLWIGERGLERIDDYMDRVMDNLESFWRAALANDGKECAWETPRRTWIPGDVFVTAACQKATDGSTPAQYCGLAGSSRTEGEITVRTRWMFNEVYRPADRHAEFAVASVLAHEMGHHMQDVFGYLRDSPPRRCCGLLPFQIELHADCLGGVWAHSLYGRREIDVEAMTQALRAADDFADTTPPQEQRLRRNSTVEERRHWYLAGFESGRVAACDRALTAPP